MMHFGATSPVFQALELKVRQATGRFGPHDAQNPTFCINCHAPVAAYVNDMLRLGKNDPVGKKLSPVGAEGVTCTICHSTNGPDLDKVESKGKLGDGIGNASLNFRPTDEFTGPTEGGDVPQARGKYHRTGFDKNRKASQYLKSSEFCGSCHDVRLPDTPDVRTGEKFQREQTLFSEWKASPYSTTKNRLERVVSCQDCHMSLYGRVNPETKKPYEPGVYSQEIVATGDLKPRKHAFHNFFGVSRALGGEGVFKKDPERELLLKKACEISFVGEAGVVVEIRNTGAGHHVPSGLSAERELWLELEARDDKNEIVYQAGNQDVTYALDEKTLEITSRRLGPDFNLRPFANVGVAQFANAFLRKKGNGVERVAAFFLADRVDNTRSIPVLTPVRVRWDLPRTAKKLRARLMYRTFHPYLLRALVDKKIADDNVAVVMAEASTELKAAPVPPDARVTPGEQTYEFTRDGKRWRFFHEPATHAAAALRCAKAGARLAAVADYDGLKLRDYRPVPGDNHDELAKERWAREEGQTYTFLRGKTAESKIAKSEERPFACVSD